MEINERKRLIIDLAEQKNHHVEAAAAALDKGDKETYNSEMTKARNIAEDIRNHQAIIVEQEAQIIAREPDPQVMKDVVAERVNALRAGRSIQLSTTEVIRGLRNSTLAASGSIVEPVGAGSEIHDPIASRASSIVDQVKTIDLSGQSGWQEPYVISEMEAQAGKIATVAGTARTATDPTFGVACINPYELSVTSFVDRNISRLSPAAYNEKVMTMAMNSLRRKLGTMIVNGDGEATPVMYGFKTAKNKAGANIFATADVSATVNENLLDTLFYAYGNDDAIGENGRVMLSKADLKAIGSLRNANKERVFKIRPDAGNPNTGVIDDGGVAIPYTIVNGIGNLTGSSANALSMVYGDPQNYLLGLFGNFTIRIDESVKAVERMVAVLGDVVVGGNLVVDKGMVVAKTKANG